MAYYRWRIPYCIRAHVRISIGCERVYPNAYAKYMCPWSCTFRIGSGFVRVPSESSPTCVTPGAGMVCTPENWVLTRFSEFWIELGSLALVRLEITQGVKALYLVYHFGSTWCHSRSPRVLWFACVLLRGRQDSGLRDPGCLYSARPARIICI